MLVRICLDNCLVRESHTASRISGALCDLSIGIRVVPPDTQGISVQLKTAWAPGRVTNMT
jgi:hypothetical protein